MSAYLQRTRALAAAALLAFAVCFGLAFATQAYAESSGGGDTQQLVPAQGLTAQAGEWTGAGTEADPYVISDAEGLQKLATDVNDGNAYANKYFQLGGDIDLSGYANWAPIGYNTSNTTSNAKAFKPAVFDGGNHVIEGMSVSAVSNGAITHALFGAASGTFKNLIVQGTVNVSDHANSNGCFAGVVAQGVDELVFENVGNEVNVSGHDGSTVRVGGIVGYCSSKVTFTGCYNKGAITGYYSQTGGLIGQNTLADTSYTACYNAGTVTLDTTYNLGTSNNVGGIVGSTAGNAQAFVGCFNYGDIVYTYENDKAAYGAIVGVQNTSNTKSSGVYYISGSMKRVYGGETIVQPNQAAGKTFSQTYAFENAEAVDAATLKSADTITALNTAASAVNEGAAFKAGKDYPILYWETSGAPVITAQPESKIYQQNATAAALAVTATLPAVGEAGADGVLSYQWFKNGEAIGGATSASYTPDTATLGVSEYYCVVTNTFTADGATLTPTATSDVATINVQDANEASTPVVAMTLAETAGQADTIEATVAVSGLTYTDGTVSYKLEQAGKDPVEGTAEVAEGAANFTVPVNTYTLGPNEVKVTVTNTYQLTKTAEGTDAKTITISGKTIASADGLADFAAQVNAGNSFENLTVTLTADIDLATLSEGKTFAPIGTSSNPFKGELNGDKHTISGLAISSEPYAALVGYASGASIHDLEVAGTVSSTNYAAGIAAYASNTQIERVANHVAVTQASSTTTTSGAGGIVGYTSGTTKIATSYNDAAIAGVNNVGGIVGYAGALDIDDCYNIGAVSNTGTLAYSNGVGGIVGTMATSYGSAATTMDNCYNAGTVTVPGDATRSFGSIGYTQSTASTIESPVCTNVFYLEGTSTVSIGLNSNGNHDGTALYADTVKPLTTATLPAAYAVLGTNWQQAPTNYHDGYPALAWETVPAAALVTFSLTEQVENLHLSLVVGEKTVLPVAQEDGTYTALLPAGTYTYTAEAFGYVTQTGEFTVADEPMTVTIPAFAESAKFAVTFAVSDGQSAIANAKIAVKNADDETMEAGADGAYQLPAGTYAYDVSAKGFIAKNDSFTVADAAVEVPVVLEPLPAEWDGSLVSEPTLEGDVYQIGHASELAWLAQQVNAGTLTAPVNAKLTADIDLNGKAWTAIGTAEKPFVGTFDGQGFAVKGLSITVSGDNDYAGLFGAVGNAENAATIKNLTTTGSINAAQKTARIGGIAAAISNTAVSDCASTVAVSNLKDGMKGAGGIVGVAETGGTSSITGCKFTGSLEAFATYNGSYVGGILGKNAAEGLVIDSCYMIGEFANHYKMGGIVGEAAAAMTIENSYASVKFGDQKRNSGILAASANKITFTNCYYHAQDGSTVTTATSSSTDPANITKVLTVADLATANLGDKFVSKPWVNDGVPVLKWEKTENAAKIAFTVADAPEDTVITLQKGEADAIVAEKQADGTFAAYIIESAQGEYSYAAKAFGYTTKTGTVTVGAEDQTIDLGAFEEAVRQTVTFSVASAEAGVELENLAIVVTNELGNAVEAAEDGTYALPAGSYTYKVTARKHLPATGEFTVAGEALTQNVTLEIVPAWDGEMTLEPALVEGVYQVGNAQELAWIAAKVNDLRAAEDVNVKLTDDINLNGKAWAPIGKSTVSYYRGTFDGDGHTVDGLYVPDSTASEYVGLFGKVGDYTGYPDYVTYPATIKNLVVKGSVSAAPRSGTAHIGGIVGYATALTMSNCGNEAAVSYAQISSTAYLGGLVGYIYSSGATQITGSYNAGSVSMTGTGTPYTVGVGGLVGYNGNSSLVITDCYNIGRIKATKNGGGLVGNGYSSYKASNSFAAGSVMGLDDGAVPDQSGVLAGYGSNYSYSAPTFTNCYALVPADSTCQNVYSGSASAPSGVTQVDSATDITVEALGESFKGDRVFMSSTPLLAWQPKTGDPLALDSNDLDVSIADVFGLGAEPEVSASYAGKDFTLGNDQVALAFYADADCTELRASPEMGTNYAKVIAKDEGDFTGSVVVSFKKALTKYKPLEGTVYISVSDDGQFVKSAKSDDVLAYLPIDLADVSTVDLDELGFGDYNLEATDGATYLYETTALQAFLYAHQAFAEDPEVRVTGTQRHMSFVHFWGYDSPTPVATVYPFTPDPTKRDWQYRINGEYAFDSALGEGQGITADAYVLQDGDFIDVALLSNVNGYMLYNYDDNGGFWYFFDSDDDEAAIIHELSGVQGQTISLNLRGRVTNADHGVVTNENCIEGVKVKYGTNAFEEPFNVVETDEDGNIEATLDSEGVYYFWMDGLALNPDGMWIDLVDDEDEIVSTPAYAKVVVKSMDAAKAELADAIAVAGELPEGIEISEDGSDITTDKQWATQEAVDALKAAIDEAQGVAANSDATPDQVADALTAIKAATKTFEDAVADGTRPLATAEQIADAETVLYNAERALEGVYKSEDGSDLEDGAKWAPADKIDAVRDAIVNLGRTLGTESLPADVLDEATTALVEAVSDFKDAEKTGPLAEYKQLEGTAYVSVSYDGKFVEGNDGALLALVPVDLAELSQIDLGSYGYEAFKKAAPENADYKYETSVLQLAIYLHEKYYADGVDGLAGYDSDPEGNWGPAHTFGISKFWGNDSPVISYNVNAEMGATTLDGLYPNDGDLIEFNMFAGNYYNDDNAGNLYFYDSAEAQYAEVAKMFDVIAGEPATLNVRKVVSSFDPVTWEPVFSVAPVEGLAVSYGTTYGEALGTAMADADGNVKITFPDEGTYYVWADGVKGAGEGVDYAVASPAFATVEAWNDSRDEYKQLYGTAYVSVSHDGKFEVSGKSGTTVMANVPVDLYEVSQIDLDEYGFSAYKKAATEEDADYKYETSVLQLAIYLHEKYYADGVDGLAGYDSDPEGNWGPAHTFGISKFWGNDNPVISYNVNAEMGATTLDGLYPNDGDFVDFDVFDGPIYDDPNSGSLYFYADGEAARGDICGTYEAEPGVETTLNVRKVVSSFDPVTWEPVFSVAPVEGLAVSYGTTYGEALGTAMADADGNVKITFPDAGKYFVWADGLKGATEGTSGYAVSSPACATAIVGTSPAAEDDLKQLARDIRNAERALNNVASSADGSDITDDETWATDEQIAAFEKAIENAKEVAEDPDASAADVAAASEALAKAKSEFQAATKNQTGAKASESTMDDLAKAIESAMSTDTAGASDEAKQALDTAIAEAESLAKNPNASSADVAAAKTKLIEAANKVSAEAAAAAQQTADKAKAADELAKAVADAESANVVDASDEAKAALAKAIKDAKDALANDGATVADLESAKAALDGALAKATDEQAAADKAKADAGKAKANSGLPVGSTFTVKDANGTWTYKVTAAKQVTLTKAAKTKKKGKATINAVAYKGVTYNVTAIGPKALAGSKLKAVTVGDNVTFIGAQAFAKNKVLKKLVVGKNVAKIGAKAFTKAKKLKKLTIKSDKLTTPASVKGSLKGSKVKTVKVPKAQKKACKKAFSKKNCGKKVKVK